MKSPSPRLAVHTAASAWRLHPPEAAVRINRYMTALKLAKTDGFGAVSGDGRYRLC
jgi:hypothetical protein